MYKFVFLVPPLPTFLCLLCSPAPPPGLHPHTACPDQPAK